MTLLVLTRPAFSQQNPKELAQEYMTQAELTLEATKAIDDARGLVVTAADLDTTFIKANYEAGRLHLITIDKNLAVKFLLRVYRQDPNYRFDIEYSIGRSYQYGEKFDKAIEFYNLYKEKLAKKANYQGKDKVDVAVVDRAIYECQNAKEFFANPKNFSIVNIGREINSEYEDYVPVLNEKETELFFTTRRREDNLNQNVADDNKPWEDIFFATKTGNTWSYAKNIGVPVNTPYHNSNLGLSADGNTLFIYMDEGGGDIYYSERANGVWGEPIPMPGIINSSFEEKSVSISSDEKTLYFSSNRPGGFGGLDLYRATKDSKGEWSNVKNLGPKINTDQDDDAPFIDYDLVTLYFSSKGHKGMGGFDVFKTTFDPSSNEWSEPENLGYPINTPDNDIYFVSSKDSKRAYYSSVREDGMGYTDIYMITIPDGLKNPQPAVAKNPEPVVEDTTQTTEPVVVKNEPKTEPVKVDPTKNQPTKNEPKTEPKNTQPKTEPKKEPKKPIVPLKYVIAVVDAGDKTPLDAKVKLVGAKDNVIVGSSSQGNGVYEFLIKNPKAKEYRLSVDRDGYAYQNQNIKIEGATTEEKTLNRTVELRKLSVGVVGILRNIYFDFDKATFETESYVELNKLEAMMRTNNNMTIELAGHTDAIGTKAYNMFLSQKRAEAVKDYLTKKGIDTRRIKAVGYGKSKPLASNDDEEEGRELNRRVEFKVLSN
ncbi:MAG TPA: OmpA family protein [Ohtaekwangia sp.]|uniref:OmpA family protein n=1 Tax=Ohtaekwangia sp. TaxID=2066019 RepID=UPI002F93CC8E